MAQGSKNMADVLGPAFWAHQWKNRHAHKKHEPTGENRDAPNRLGRTGENEHGRDKLGSTGRK